MLGQAAVLLGSAAIKRIALLSEVFDLTLKLAEFCFISGCISWLTGSIDI